MVGNQAHNFCGDINTIKQQTTLKFMTGIVPQDQELLTLLEQLSSIYSVYCFVDNLFFLFWPSYLFWIPL